MSYIAESAVISANVKISPYCVIGEEVVLEEGVILGVGCVIGAGVCIEARSKLGNYITLGVGVKLGEEVQIGDHTTLCQQVTLGKGCNVGSSSTLGRLPRPASTSTVKVQDDLAPLIMGSEGIVGCSAVLYAGTTYGDQVFVGDRAVVRERCIIGHNTVIGSGVAVENDTRIGPFTKIQTGAYITAYTEIEDHVFIAPMVTTTNDNFMGRTEKRFKLVKGAKIGRGARIGGASILLPGIKVAPETFVAAGALVTKDTVERKVVMGFPAKELREVPEEELLK